MKKAIPSLLYAVSVTDTRNDMLLLFNLCHFCDFDYASLSLKTMNN